MSAQSYGGIRAGGTAQMSGQLAARLGASPASASPVPIGASPMATQPPVAPRALSPEAAQVLMVMVVLELGALAALRYGFRNNHGG